MGQINNSSDLIKKLEGLKQKPGYNQDTAYVNTINQLAFLYANSYPDSALSLLDGKAAQSLKADYPLGATEAYKIMGNAWQTKGDFENSLLYYERAYTLAKKDNLQKVIPGILNNIGLVRSNQGNYPEALKIFYQTLTAANAVNDKFVKGSALNNIATVDFYLGKMDEADSAYKQTLQIALEMNDSIGVIYAYNNIGEVNMEQNKTSEALVNFQKAFKIASMKNIPDVLVGITINLGNTYLAKDSFPQAIFHYEKALVLAKQNDYGLETAKALIGLANVRLRQGNLKTALANGLEGINKAQQMGQTQLLRDANKVVAEIYEKSGDGMDALMHFKMFKVFSDSLNNLATVRASANEKANYRISQKQLQFEKASVQQRWYLFSALAALISLGIILWIIAYNKRRLKKKNMDLEYKNEIINNQKQKVEQTLSTLKSTQAQLIQSEKMASLGVLTSGIAHEIQNPLNFVNNFSELSNELMDEMKDELSKGNYEVVHEIVNDVQQNLEKINHHGKRADAIVKGMLQHSRKETGTKEPTDINALCNEFLKLSYSGFRAKKNSDNPLIPILRETDFDKNIGKVNIIPQEIGRVLLNLLNNAFYACAERTASVANEKKIGDKNYQPKVLIETKKVNNKLQVKISDNGSGISEDMMDKIFQPFFTTKSTGEGTGLGLSLSYDIIKAHEGDIHVESKAGEGSSFIFSLPID
jgi:signal transduction histidine kinase